MSAAEKLRALGAGFDRVTPIMRKTGPKMLGSEAYVHAKDIHEYVNALPQLVAVVEAAERYPFDPFSLDKLRLSLDALDKALT